jgi:hypothetical protein
LRSTRGVLTSSSASQGSGYVFPRFATEALGSGHIGLASSRERAEAVGGSFRVGARDDGQRGTQAVAILG